MAIIAKEGIIVCQNLNRIKEKQLYNKTFSLSNFSLSFFSIQHRNGKIHTKYSLVLFRHSNFLEVSVAIYLSFNEYDAKLCNSARQISKREYLVRCYYSVVSKVPMRSFKSHNSYFSQQPSLRMFALTMLEIIFNILVQLVKRKTIKYTQTSV